MNASRIKTARFTDRSRPTVIGLGLEISTWTLSIFFGMDKLPVDYDTAERLVLGSDQITVLALRGQLPGRAPPLARTRGAAPGR
jgi:hypothetical protein